MGTTLNDLNRSRELLDCANAWIRRHATNDLRKPVIADPGNDRNLSPGAGTLAGVEVIKDLCVGHSPILGIAALPVNVNFHKRPRHTVAVPKLRPSPPTVFHERITEMVGTSPVNAWAKSKRLDQSLVQRIVVNGLDVRLSTLMDIARKLGTSPASLLSKDGLASELLTPAAVKVAGLFDRMSPLNQGRVVGMIEIMQDPHPVLPGRAHLEKL